MKKIIFTVAATISTLALTNCAGLAIKGADEGSQLMVKDDNSVISNTGKTIQKGVKPINKAKDEAVDAMKDAFD